MIMGQSTEKEVIAKEENKIQIFISYNCILALGLDPVEAESSQPAPLGLGLSPCSPPAVAPHTSSKAAGAPGMGRERGASAGTVGEGMGDPRRQCTPGISVTPSLPQDMT